MWKEWSLISLTRLAAGEERPDSSNMYSVADLHSTPAYVMVRQFMAAFSPNVPTIDPQMRWTILAPGANGTNPLSTGQHWIKAIRLNIGCGWPCRKNQ